MKRTPEPKAKTAAARYSQLESAREPFLIRARDAATLTVPSLLPPRGHTPTTKLPTPYQGIGARGLNHLASKLLLALFPPNSPFFRMVVDDFTLERITKRQGMRAEVEKALNRFERAVMTEIEQRAIRVSGFEALKQLILAGNVLCYLTDNEGMKVFRLDRYVVSRDDMGNVLEIVVKETVSPDVLTSVYDFLDENESEETKSTEKSVDLYTHIYLEDRTWYVYQECRGQVIPGTAGTYPYDKSPWLALRWSKIDSEDYGRGYIEEYLGDLKSLEALTKAIVEGSAAASKVLFLVNPNGTTKIKSITDAPNGAVRAGTAEDVTVLQVAKSQDFQVTLKTLEMIQQRLSFAFLLNTSVQRSGERVTAEEIRFMAGELEDALGGVYSILSQELQYPLVQRLIFSMERGKKLPVLPKDLVRPTITTGLEALGRGHDLNKLSQLLQVIGPLGPDVIKQYLNVGDYITRSGTSLGIDMDGLVRSQDEVDQMQQAAQQQAMMQELASKAAPGAMNIARDHLQPQDANGPQAAPQPQ